MVRFAATTDSASPTLVHRRPAARAPRIVALGGGTGLPAVLEGLRELAADGGPAGSGHISAIVTVTDDGGSSGRLRRELGVLPPGDIRNCLAALTPSDSPYRQLLQHRFADGDGLRGHTVGNLMLTALAEMSGDFPAAIDQLARMINLGGRVMPSTKESVRLRAELDSGEVLHGETQIVSARAQIRRLTLDPSPRPLPEVLRAIVNAEAIVVGPGSLYTSVLPNLLVEGIAATISGVDAVRIYVANLMTEPGETTGYTLDDHLRAIKLHVGFDLFDYIIVNRRPIPQSIAARYALQGARPVERDGVLQHKGRAQLVECDLFADCHGGKIRHAPQPLARAIQQLVARGRAE